MQRVAGMDTSSSTLADYILELTNCGRFEVDIVQDKRFLGPEFK
jgi:hypothetical protein